MQQSQPFGPLVPRRVVTLPAEHIHPVVRIAHRVRFPLDIPERILFDHEFVLILAGAGEMVLGSESFPYQAHDLLFIPPFLPHSFVAPVPGGGEHVAIHFDFSAQVGGLNEELEQRTPYEIRLASSLRIPRRQFAPPGGLLEQALLNLVREQISTDPLAGLRTTREMLSVLESALSNQNDSPSLVTISADQAKNKTQGSKNKTRVNKNKAQVQRMIAFIHSSLHTHLDAARLGQVADLSVSRMNTVFRQETGYSPLEYVRRERVAKARRLLADPELSVKEIAARTGFEDSFHFSRVFRQIDGLSPTHYREALLAAHPNALQPLTSQPIGEIDIR